MLEAALVGPIMYPGFEFLPPERPCFAPPLPLKFKYMADRHWLCENTCNVHISHTEKALRFKIQMHLYPVTGLTFVDNARYPVFI